MQANQKIRLCLLLLTSFCSAPALGATVIFVKGDVRISAGEFDTLLARGMAIDEASTLQSQDGFAQIRLNSGQLLSVRPGDTLVLSADAGETSEDNADDASSRRIKALLRKAGGTSERASRTTFPEQVIASGDTSALEIVNSLNFSTLGPANTPPVTSNATAMVGVLPGGGSQMTLPAQSSSQGEVDKIHIEAVVENFGVSRNDSSSVYPLDAAADSLLTQTTNDETGITWGRWDSGQGYDTEVNAPFEFSEAALHALIGNRLVIQSSDSASYFTAERTGTANYTLIGNTDPTDNFGHSGQLGAANLQADFDLGTVQASVMLEIAPAPLLGDFDAGNASVVSSETWQASGAGQLGSNGGFDGTFSQVTAGGRTGTGEFMGFVQDASELEMGTAAGAGFSYLLQSENQRVGGVAAFIQEKE